VLGLAEHIGLLSFLFESSQGFHATITYVPFDFAICDSDCNVQGAMRSLSQAISIECRIASQRIVAPIIMVPLLFESIRMLHTGVPYRRDLGVREENSY
jgi:hypothetical protein